MNIIPSVSTDNPKVAKSAGESAQANVDGVATPAEGFLSKLVALVKGSGGEETKPLEATKSINPEAISESENAGSEKMEAGKASDTQASESSSTDELLAQDAAGKHAEDESVSGQSNKESASKAELIVSGNEEVLKRLNDANNALQPKGGKALPQQSDTDPVATAQGATQSVVGDKSNESVKPLVHSDTDINTDASQVTTSEEGVEVQSDTAAIPESAKRFIQNEVDSSSTGKNKEHLKSEDAEVKGSLLKASSEALQEPGSKGTKQDLAAESAKLSDEKLTESHRHLSDKDASEVKNTPEHEQKIDSGQSQPPTETQTVKTAHLSPGVDQADIVKLEGDQETGSSVQSIPWTVNNVDSTSPEIIAQPSIEAKAKAAPAHQSTIQSPMSAQATHVATQNQTASSLLQAETPNAAVNPQLINTPVSAPVTAAVTEQALLKTAMGAKAAATLSGALTDKPESERGSESSFAHQLSQAAGVQQSALTTGQPRIEQANTQVPLQLSREMASDEVAERVQMMLSKNLKNIDIRLDPPELGRMQIRMNMNGDGATVHFTVANQHARDALEQSMPRLREMLAQQGVQLGDTSVQQQSGNQQQSRYASNQQSQSGQGSSNQSGVGEENLEADINLDLNVAAKRDGISYYA